MEMEQRYHHRLRNQQIEVRIYSLFMDRKESNCTSSNPVVTRKDFRDKQTKTHEPQK